jgi:Flp pilus assembly protein CpaB
MKIYFAINKIICLLLCFFVMLGAFSLTACSSSEDTSKNEEQPPLEQYALALRAITNINVGDSFSEDKVEVVRVRTDALPCGTYSVMTELCGKYATSAICVGDFITEEKVTDLSCYC